MEKFRLTLQSKILLNELNLSDKIALELKDKTHYVSDNIYSVLKRLVSYGLIKKIENKYRITDKGIKYIS